MMLKTKLLERLKQIDIKNTQEHHVASLPDFFVDHFVTLKKFDDTCSAMDEIVQQGGGNLPEIAQIIHQGGSRKYCTSARTAWYVCTFDLPNQ